MVNEAELWLSRFKYRIKFAPTKFELGVKSCPAHVGRHLIDISPTFRVLYRFFTSVFKTAEPLLRGQRAGGGGESAIKTIAYHSLSPSFSAMKTQKLAPSPCLSSQSQINDFDSHSGSNKYFWN